MNSVEFSKGVEATGVYSFTKKDHTKVKLEICKTETEELTYKLAFKYLGPKTKNRDAWEVLINDQRPLYSSGNSLYYLGSRKFDVRPSSGFVFNGLAILEIEETDEKETGKILFDMSARSPVVINEKLMVLRKNWGRETNWC